MTNEAHLYRFVSDLLRLIRPETSPEVLYAAIHEQLRLALPPHSVDAFVISLHEPVLNLINFAYFKAPNDLPSPRNRPLSRNGGLSDWVIMNKRSRLWYIDEPDNDLPGTTHPVQARYAVPMIIDGRAFGAMIIESFIPGFRYEQSTLGFVDRAIVEFSRLYSLYERVRTGSRVINNPHAPFMVCRIQDGRVIEANSRALDVLGFSAEEITGKPYLDLIAEEDRLQESERHTGHAHGRSENIQYSIRLLKKSGGTLPVETIIFLGDSYNGRPALIATWIDVSEVQRIQREANAIVTKHTQNLETIVAERTRQLVESNEKLSGLVARLEQNNQLLESAQNVLARREEQLGSILDTMRDAVVTIDSQGAIRGVNPAATRIFGYTPDALHGQNITMIIPPELREAHVAGLSRCADPGGQRLIGRVVEMEALHADGSLVPVEISISSYDVRGSRYYTGILHDITERRKKDASLRATIERLTETNRRLEEAQNQLLQSEKMASVGQLAAGVAHEINNPMGFITSNLGSLKNQVCELLGVPDVYRGTEPALAAHPELIERIRQARESADLEFLQEDIQNLIAESLDGAHRVKKIVENLKDFARVDNAEWLYANLEHGLESTLNIVRNELKYKAEIIKEYSGLPEIECIASQLNQVFMNLMVNAAHAIESRGVITLRTGFDEKNVWIEVEDNGIGISAEHLGRIFDPFFTTKPAGKGTGLGLSLAYSIVQRHNGRFYVCSEPGHGSRFRVILPREHTS